MINIKEIKRDPIKYLPEFFLNSKRHSNATKTIKDELIFLRDYSKREHSYSTLSDKYKYSRKMIYRIFKKWGKIYPPNLGKVKRYNRKFSILDDIKICKLYIKGKSIYATSRKFETCPKAVEGILNRYGFKLRSRLESSYLRHKKKPLKYPLSTYVPNLLDKKLKKYFPDLITILTLTDGTCTPPGKSALKAKRPKLAYYGTPTLCRIYIDLIKYYYSLEPSVFNRRKDGTYNVIYERKEIKEKLLPHLLTYSPSFKTSPAKKQTKSNYLEEEQPSLNFLENKPKKVLIEAIRLGMSAEGFCGPFIKNRKMYPNLGLSCSHPILVEQWTNIVNKLGLSFKFTRNKAHWSEIDGIKSSKLRNLKRFNEIGGFIDKVKISKHSKYYTGIDKNTMIKGILEWQDQKKRFDYDNKNNQAHKVFRKFIKDM